MVFIIVALHRHMCSVNFQLCLVLPPVGGAILTVHDTF